MKKETTTEKNICFLINMGFENQYSKGRDSWTGAGIEVSSTAIEHTEPDLFIRMVKNQIIKRIETYH